MYDVYLNLKTIDAYTVYVIGALVAFVFWAVREIVGSAGLAALFVPFLALGGLAANYLFQISMVTLSSDKDTNVVAASAIGILVALVLMVLSVWMASCMKERRVKAKKLTAIQPLPRHAN